MKGIIFDIQRFALHDGPGIRTVVYLKGCPLSCVWCCNPESNIRDIQLSYSHEKCNGCMECINVCPENCIYIDRGKVKIDFLACNSCGKCLDYCAQGALKIIGEEMDSDSIIHIVEKDIPYYQTSGGGLTLSGGDALFQFHFALDIMKKAKEKKIDICLETEGFGSIEQFKTILPFVNRFYFDYKITNSGDHKKYTGHDNNIVLTNLDFICNQKTVVTLRCPVIPGINDNYKHFKAITELSNKYKNIIDVQIMPYHDYGRRKFFNIGRIPYDISGQTVKQEKAQEWIKTLQNMGCNKINNIEIVNLL